MINNKPESDIGGPIEKRLTTMDILLSPDEVHLNSLFCDINSRIEKIEARIDKMALVFKETTHKKTSVFEFTKEHEELIKKSLPPDAQNELNSFLYQCKQYELDPLKKEILLTMRSNKAVIMVTRDGLLKIANRDPHFDGIGGDVVYEGDTLAKRDNESIHITYGTEHLVFNKEKIKGAFANVYRKDRSKCTTVFVSFKDYFKKSTTNTLSIWEQFPNAMILKVAESMALKRAFSLSGLTSQEEIGE